MHTIQATITIDAKPDDVFALISDHERFFRAPGMTCRLATPGRHDRNGVGAVREIATPGYVFTEEVIEFDPPRRFAYVIRAVVGPGARLAPTHERGWVELSSDGEKTRVDWYSKFGARIPVAGWVFERAFGAGLRSAFGRLLKSAKAQIENDAGR